MPESLLRYPNERFYDSLVKCAKQEKENSPPGFPWPNKNEPLAFLECGNNSEIAHNFGGRSNPTEMIIILSIIEKVIEAGEIEPKNIAIISPYNKQVQLIRAELASMSWNRQGISDIKIGTVDSFQGAECDLAIFSAV